jgi:predicted DNA-binding transcriptional regulator AlpA
MPDQPLSATVLLRKPEVLRRIGNPDNSTLSRWIKAGQFPEPVILNPNGQRQMVAWRESEVEAWLASRPRGVAAKPKPQVFEGRMRQAAAKRQAAVEPRAKPRREDLVPGPKMPRMMLKRPTI